jgi:signal transduction histidine kinase
VLRLENAGDNVMITISDTGPGIPKEMQNRIFEPFFSTKESASGTGLGLSIVYGIVRAHQGAIVVDSAPGRGATFRITLPVDGPHKPGQETEQYGHA